MRDEAVGSRAERGMPRCRAIEGIVNIDLQMFDTDPHGEGLACERDVAAKQELEDVSRGMTAGKNEV